MTCTFFGHSYTEWEVKPKIKEAVEDLIKNHGVNRFYVGNHGSFDKMVQEVLSELSQVYEIDYKTVWAKVPGSRDEFDEKDYFSTTTVPDGIEKILPRFRIVFRNKWMIKQSDYVVTYITNRFGNGAAQFAKLAEKQGKIMIKLGDGNL